MNVTYKNCDLFDSKCFVTMGREAQTKIELEYRGEKIYFIMEFQVDETKQQKHEFVIPDNQTFMIKFTNWENPLGMGFTEPLDVGTIGSRKLFLVLWIKKAGSKSSCHEVTVSAYVGEEV